MAIDTGNGATIAWTTNTGYNAFNVTNMGLGSWAIPAIDTSHLGSAGFKEYIPGDLKEPNQMTIELQFDTSDATGSPALESMTNMTSADTVTVTFPDGSATLAGTAFITDFEWPTLENNSLMSMTFNVQFDGSTGPTFTDNVP